MVAWLSIVSRRQGFVAIAALAVLTAIAAGPVVAQTGPVVAQSCTPDALASAVRQADNQTLLFSQASEKILSLQRENARLEQDKQRLNAGAAQCIAHPVPAELTAEITDLLRSLAVARARMAP